MGRRRTAAHEVQLEAILVPAPEHSERVYWWLREQHPVVGVHWVEPPESTERGLALLTPERIDLDGVALHLAGRMVLAAGVDVDAGKEQLWWACDGLKEQSLLKGKRVVDDGLPLLADSRSAEEDDFHWELEQDLFAKLCDVEDASGGAVLWKKSASPQPHECARLGIPPRCLKSP